MPPEAAAPATPTQAPAPKPAAAKAPDSLGKSNRAAAIAQLDAAAETQATESTQAAPEAPAAPEAKTNGVAAPSVRDEINARYAEFQRRTAQLSEGRAARERAKAEDAQRRSEAEAHSKQLAAARLADEDPFAYLESRGITADELVKRGVTRGSPEAKIEAKLIELEQWKQQQIKADQERQQRTAHEQAQAQYFQARQYLEGLVDKHAEIYPTLDSMAPSYVSYQAYQLAAQYYRDSGEVPNERTAMQILAFLEKTEHDARVERQKRRTPAAGAAPPGAKKPPTPPPPPTSPKKGQTLRDVRRERGLAILDRAEREGR